MQKIILDLSSIVVFCLLAFACSFDYDSVELSDEISEDIPDIVLGKFSHTAVRNGILALQIESEQAEIYDKKELIVLMSVVFYEYDADEELATEGAADFAILHTASNDVELIGNLNLYSISEKTLINSDYLYWYDEDKTFVSAEDGYVEILRDQGSSLVGRGFIGNMRELRFEFLGSSKGEWKPDEE